MNTPEAAQPAHAPSNWTSADWRRRTSMGITLAGGAAAIAAGSARFWRDGSLWLDEASIAHNLLNQSAGQLLTGPYLTNHSFPRLYLLGIDGATALLGYETMVLRALPFAAFLAWLVLYYRLILRRFGGAPLLIGLWIVLTLVPATGFVFPSMVKQYTLDAALALVPIAIGDAFYERTLRRGESPLAIALLAAPILISFTYVIPLLGRVLGWALVSGRHDGLSFSPRGVATFVASTFLGLALLYVIDLRHTALDPQLLRFWKNSILSGDVGRDLSILGRMMTRWYTGELSFGARTAVPAPVVAVLLAASALGLVEIARRTWAGRGAGEPADRVWGWGSRSTGAVVMLFGLVAAGVVTQYPQAAGRLTLFALFAFQLLILEGFAALHRWARRQRAAQRATSVLLALVAIACTPAAYANLRHVITRNPPENVRPLLPLIAERPELPVVIAICSEKQISTLPEWREREDIVYFGEREGPPTERLPEAREFWILSAGSARYCPFFMPILEPLLESRQPRQRPGDTASLLLARLSDEAMAEREAFAQRRARGETMPTLMEYLEERQR